MLGIYDSMLHIKNKPGFDQLIEVSQTYAAVNYSNNV